MGRQETSIGRLRALDLFCGAGGLSEGFRQAGYDIAFGIDSDEDSCRTFARNHRSAHVEHASISDLAPSDIARLAGEDIDVILGGPSCQGFSSASKTRWDLSDERNQLWLHMLRVVEFLKPQAFILENVPGLVHWKEGGFGAAILGEFRNLGYNVAPPHILLAADFGVPQLRRRLFIVGLRGRQFQFPEQTHMGGWRRDTLEMWEERRQELGLLRHISTWEAIGDLPLIVDSDEGRAAYAGIKPTPYIRRIRKKVTVLRDHQVPELAQQHAELIKHVPQGGTWRDIPRHLLPDRFRGMRRTDSSNLLGRLDPDRPSYTLTTQFYNVTAGCFVHPFQDRPLSLREGARLQSFPDSYRLSGSLKSRYRQVGNAVPPLLASVLATEIARQLGEKKSVKPVKPIRPAAQKPPPPTDTKTSARMRKQKRRNTAPEILLREQLDLLGVGGYSVDEQPLPGLRRKADLTFADARVAVFVDGCFWHGCPAHDRPTKSNTTWWADKIAANKARDRNTTRALQRQGWRVIRIWEHVSPESAAKRIAEELVELAPAISEAS